MNSMLKDFFTENLSSKIVSLFIALILWMTILGRRDFVQSKEIDVEIYASLPFQVTKQSSDHIRVRVSGSKNALKKFVEGNHSQTVFVDISSEGEGIHQVEIQPSRIDVPIGVKVLSIKPNVIQAEVARRP